MASDVPTDYHGFVTYLRKKDAAFQEIDASQPTSTPWRPHLTPAQSRQDTQEPTVSQGGSAMDLDIISRERSPDGHLTAEAKEARRALGRCLWCNKTGHLRSNCPLGSRNLAPATSSPRSPQKDLKEVLQQ